MLTNRVGGGKKKLQADEFKWKAGNFGYWKCLCFLWAEGDYVLFAMTYHLYCRVKSKRSS